MPVVAVVSLVIVLLLIEPVVPFMVPDELMLPFVLFVVEPEVFRLLLVLLVVEPEVFRLLVVLVLFDVPEL